MQYKLILLLPCLPFVFGCKNTIPDRTPLAPPFVADTANGGSLSLMELSKNRNVLIVFASADGEVGKSAFAIAKRIEDELGPDNWVALGAINTDADKLGAWRKGSAIEIVGDPSARFAMRYKARISPTFQIIGKGGTWGQKVEGCDAISMEELEKALDMRPGTLKGLGNQKGRDSQNIW